MADKHFHSGATPDRIARNCATHAKTECVQKCAKFAGESILAPQCAGRPVDQQAYPKGNLRCPTAAHIHVMADQLSKHTMQQTHLFRVVRLVFVCDLSADLKRVSDLPEEANPASSAITRDVAKGDSLGQTRCIQSALPRLTHRARAAPRSW